MDMKRIITAALLCLAMLSSAVYAAAGFLDVPESHWGLEYIQQAAEAGIIEGETLADGTVRFRPEDMVSKQECITMLYRTLDNLDALSTREDLRAEYEQTLRDCDIASWADLYAAYGFDSRILQEKDFDEVSGSRSGGAVYESRQMIAMWTAKAMQYPLAPLTELVYKDSSSIDDEYIPYVDALYREGIMEGDKQVFNPLKGVKRVEIATVCTRLLDSGRRWQNRSLEDCLIAHHGICGDLDTEHRRFSVTEDGQTVPLFVPESSVILLNGAQASMEDLAKLNGTQISACAFLGGTDTVVIQTRPLVQTGVIRTVEDMGDYSLLEIDTGGVRVSYVLTEDTQQLSAVKKNKNCSFIADGICLLEIE